MKEMLKYLKNYKKESVLAPFFKMLEALFDLFVPLVMADIINNGIANKDMPYIYKRCILLVILAVVGLACCIIAQYFAAKAAVGYATGLKKALFRHIQGLEYSELDKFGSNTLITRMTSDVNLVQNGLNMFLRLFLRSPFIVFGAMIMAFTVDARTALIFVCAIPVLAVIVFGIMKITAPMYKNVQAVLDKVMGITRENLSGVRVVRAFHRESAETERFENENGILSALQTKAGTLSALMNPLTYVAVNIAIAAILYSGAVSVNVNGLMQGDVVALVNYMSQILVELIKLANLIVQVTKAVAGLGRIKNVMDTKSELTFPENSSIEDSKKDMQEAAVRFSHVSLAYKNASEESISDINFTAAPSEVIGIIGGTGSGKTSIVNLIARFYEPTLGEVELFGRKAQSYPKDIIRNMIGIVPQKAQLFSGTIRSNLLWGNEEATDEELWEALKLSQAAEFVASKSKELDEIVSQGGRNLSGGQKQRLTIARAIVKKPKILILDDSSSALDYATDAALRKAIKTLSASMTVFIVSQRTASLRSCDKILVIDDGKLEGFGNNEQLLKSCAVYREIHNSQFAAEEAI